MYSRSYNKNNAPFTVPRQYSGVAFSRPREADGARAPSPLSKPPVSYSREAGERLYAPGDFPKINVPMSNHEEKDELPGRDRETFEVREERRIEEKTDEKVLEAVHRRPSFLNSLGALGDDALMLLALILLLSGCEDAGDTVMILIFLLLLG